MQIRTLPDAIRAMIAEYDDTPESINTGYCADFATTIWRLMGDDVMIVSDEDMGEEYTHTFLLCASRYYDAECPDGCANWRDLPIFARQAQERASGDFI